MMTDRKKIYQVLKTLNFDVFNIGQNYKMSDSPYLVLRNAGQDSSVNRLGGFTTWEVLAYVPDTSIVMLDTILDSVEQRLAVSLPGVRINGQRGMDYHDEEINMYMNYLQFIVPKTVRGC